jgi:hypothetical protein
VRLLSSGFHPFLQVSAPCSGTSPVLRFCSGCTHPQICLRFSSGYASRCASAQVLGHILRLWRRTLVRLLSSGFHPFPQVSAPCSGTLPVLRFCSGCAHPQINFRFSSGHASRCTSAQVLGHFLRFWRCTQVHLLCSGLSAHVLTLLCPQDLLHKCGASRFSMLQGEHCMA